jgi:type IV pilus assembly protein PilO
MKKLQELLDQLRGLDPNDPGRWPLGARVGTIGVVFFIACLGLYYLFVWKPQHPLLLEARAKETELWDTLDAKARKAANLNAYKVQLAEMEKSFGAMLRNLLVDISQTGLAAGLDEKLFQPLGEIRKDFYAELPIAIRLTGGYHEMGRFASGIAALPRIVTLHDIEIVPAAAAGVAKGADPGVLTLNVTAKTYRYLDEEEATADGGKARKGQKKPAGG